LPLVILGIRAKIKGDYRMEYANRLETHYYLDDKSHKIDALVRKQQNNW